MLRFVRNIITHQTDHKFKTLDEVYNKIDKWLPGLFQSWKATKVTIYKINTSKRTGSVVDILINLKEQWNQLKKLKEDQINLFSNYYSKSFHPSHYTHNKVAKYSIKEYQININKNKIPITEIPRNNKTKVSKTYHKYNN